MPCFLPCTLYFTPRVFLSTVTYKRLSEKTEWHWQGIYYTVGIFLFLLHAILYAWLHSWVGFFSSFFLVAVSFCTFHSLSLYWGGRLRLYTGVHNRQDHDPTSFCLSQTLHFIPHATPSLWVYRCVREWGQTVWVSSLLGAPSVNKETFWFSCLCFFK